MNLKRVMDGLTRSGIGGGFARQPAGSKLSRAIRQVRPQDAADAALATSGAAVIGELAWSAYSRYRANVGRSSVATGWSSLVRASFLPQDVYSQEFLDFLLLRAMITAAGADGHIDGRRRADILRRICILDMTPEEKAFLIGEIQRPMSMEQLVDYARSPDLALEIYTASALAVDAAHPDSWRFLETLARHLELPEGLAREVHRQATSDGRNDDLTWRGLNPVAQPLASA